MPKTDAAGSGDHIVDQKTRRQRRAHFDHEHHRVLRNVTGLSFTNDSRDRAPRISGSNSGRARASFFDRSDVGSSCGDLCRLAVL